MVGNDSRDDAAVYQIDEQNALISVPQIFFCPLWMIHFQFGEIAAANAISDVYAMGGNPIFALAVLGWPIDTIASFSSTRSHGRVRKGLFAQKQAL